MSVSTERQHTGRIKEIKTLLMLHTCGLYLGIGSIQKSQYIVIMITGITENFET